MTTPMLETILSASDLIVYFIPEYTYTRDTCEVISQESSMCIVSVGDSVE